MEFHVKLQELRKRKGMTQEELAQQLYVSRTAISKWESGRGYPNIDSLKQIAKLFSVTIDELLSSDELLSVAEADNKNREQQLRALTFGLLDMAPMLFLVLPLLGQIENGVIQTVSLLGLSVIARYLKLLYVVVVCLSMALGLFMIALQNCDNMLWKKVKYKLSLSINLIAVLLFILGRQPYAAVFVFVLLFVKVIMLFQKR